MTKPISAAAIHAMRMQWKRAKTPAIDPTERARCASAARKAKRDAYRAEVLRWGVSRWDVEAARLRAIHGPLCPVELGIGIRPERYCPSLGDLYERTRNDSIY